MPNNKITSTDVAKLLKDPSPDHRADVAVKLSEQLSSGALAASERKIVEDIFRAMVHDVEVRVRQALAESLKDNPNIPHDVAKSLASDVADVAIPVVENSAVLSDEDLLEIVSSKGADFQQAVASRKVVSEKVSDALADTGNEDVVATLVSNKGAQISEQTLEKVASEFAENAKVNAPLALRENLPLKVADKLVAYVSEQIQAQLIAKHDLSQDVAMDLVIQSREKAFVSFLDPNSKAPDLLELVHQLHENGRLTPSIIVRAVCMGDVSFFEAALAVLTKTPIPETYMTIHADGPEGVKGLFEKAGIPQGMLNITNAALEAAKEAETTSGDDRDRFSEIMIERVLTKCEDEIEGDSLDYFIGKIGKK